MIKSKFKAGIKAKFRRLNRKIAKEVRMVDTNDYCAPIGNEGLTDVPILSTATYDYDYNMKHKKRGFCLILNHGTFLKRNATASLGPRHGTQLDADACVKVFTQLDFEVLLHTDSKLADVKKILKELAAFDHSDMDCFACIVLTHGDHGHLYAADGRYPIDLLFSAFLGNNCKTLAGKPKLFFIQACQGSLLDRGVLVESIDSAHYFKIPSYADFLIAYSTLPGFYSWRNTEKGSWFILALVQILREHHLHTDLLTMMTLVSHRVAYGFSSNAATLEQSGMKQVPCITSMLTRRVFFYPKKSISFNDPGASFI